MAAQQPKKKHSKPLLVVGFKANNEEPLKKFEKNSANTKKKKSSNDVIVSLWWKKAPSDDSLLKGTLHWHQILESLWPSNNSVGNINEISIDATILDGIFLHHSPKVFLTFNICSCARVLYQAH